MPPIPLSLQAFLYNANLVKATGGTASTTLGSFTINLGQYQIVVSAQKSDWDCAAALWYNRVLSAAEYLAVEAWLNKVYCIVAFPPPPPAPPSCECNRHTSGAALGLGLH
jgi:hypothetical protein